MMWGHKSVLLFLVVTSCLGCRSFAQRGGEVNGLDGGKKQEHGGTNPCSCALLNFWDTTQRQEVTNCCKALTFICMQNNSLACGHVHRFCTKQKAGYSAWVLDVFVREQLKELGTCVEFNPNATHDEQCGDGWCRIGYTCTTVKAERCRQKPGVRCGPGYCKYGSFCAEMSSESCSQRTKAEVEDLQKVYDKKDIDVKCDNERCNVCTRDLQDQCVFKEKVQDPCLERNCADSVQCGVEEEEVCTVRPEVLIHVGDDIPKEHDPEKVDESKLRRRLTAYVVPTAAAMIGVIFSIALISWGFVRVKRARKEAAMQAEEDCMENNLSIRTDLSAIDEKDPLSPPAPSSSRTPKTRINLPIPGGDAEGGARSSGRRSTKKTPGKWTPGSHYRSVSDIDNDLLTGLDDHVHGGNQRAVYQMRGNLKRTRSRSVDADKDESGDELGTTPSSRHHRCGSLGAVGFA